MKRVVIMQPTYLPWLGYFDLIDQADVFVFRDDVQFEKQSWQQRNRIKTPQGVVWLTVPVRKPLMQAIFKMEIDVAGSARWARSHWNILRNAYQTAPYWKTFEFELEQLYRSQWERLAELNIALIEWLAEKLGITVRFVRASAEEGLPQGKHEALVAMTQRFDGTVYLSPLGSAVYLQDDQLFAAHNLRVEFQHYEHPEYQQLYPPFVSHLSALDLLLNEGAGSLEILRAGRRAAYSTAEAAQLITRAGVREHDASALSS